MNVVRKDDVLLALNFLTNRGGTALVWARDKMENGTFDYVDGLKLRSEIKEKIFNIWILKESDDECLCHRTLNIFLELYEGILSYLDSNGCTPDHVYLDDFIDE